LGQEEKEKGGVDELGVRRAVKNGSEPLFPSHASALLFLAWPGGGASPEESGMSSK